MSERVIKFRIYDMVEKVMLCPPPAYMLMEIGDGTIWFNDGHGCGDRLESKNPNRYQLMQFVGLHDKSGKEIYEGDVVTAEIYQQAGTGERIFVMPSYAKLVPCLVKWQQSPSPGFYLGATNLWMASYWHYEIIGNIHEHPELLSKELT